MTHGHREIRNSRTIRLEGKSGLSSSRGLIRQGLGQCPAGAISADGTVAICRILYQTTVWPAPALAPAPAPAQVPAIVRKAWSVDARNDQTHAAHRPTGSLLWGYPESVRRRCSLSISCHVEAMVGQDSGLESTQSHIAMGVYQRLDHHRTTLLPDNGMQSPQGTCCLRCRPVLCTRMPPRINVHTMFDMTSCCWYVPPTPCGRRSDLSWHGTTDFVSCFL